MAEATNAQMQAYCDQRLRPRAEQIRGLEIALADDKASIDDEYARAAGSNAWADNRTDGPPHLLQAGASANPDDVLNYNALAANLLWLLSDSGPGNDVGGTLAQFKTAVRNQLAILARACVRPAGA